MLLWRIDLGNRQSLWTWGTPRLYWISRLAPVTQPREGWVLLRNGPLLGNPSEKNPNHDYHCKRPDEAFNKLSDAPVDMILGIPERHKQGNERAPYPSVTCHNSFCGLWGLLFWGHVVHFA